MTEVQFLRIRITNAESITAQLAFHYLQGWRVISHVEQGDEYSFVLERRTS